MINKTVCYSSMPITVQAGLRVRKLALHSNRSYGYAFRSRAALTNTNPAPAPYGVELVEAELIVDTVTGTDTAAANPSVSAEKCARLFRDIVVRSAVLAGLSGNLHRLLAEYRVTERRSRALENIILPEIDQAPGDMTSHLEELELEDAIRVRPQSD